MNMLFFGVRSMAYRLPRVKCNHGEIILGIAIKVCQISVLDVVSIKDAV